MTGGRVALGSLLAAFAYASAAEAQVSASGMLQGRQARQIDTSVNFRVEHDTNIVRSSRALADARGVEMSDTVFTPGIDTNIVLPLGQQAVFLRGRASYVFHDRNEQLDHSRYDLSAGVANRLGPCGSVIGGGYSRSRSELDDQRLDESIFNILTVKRVNLSVNCARPPGLGVVFGVGADRGDNSAATSQQSDFETVSANAGIQYGRPALGTFILQANYARTEYPNRPTLTGRTDGYELLGVGLTAERRFGARIQGVIRGGYTRVELLEPAPIIPGAANGGLKEFEGFTYSGEITYRASSRLRASAIFDRSISPTLATAQSYEVQTNYEVRGEYQIGSRISAELSAAQRESEANGADLPGLLLLSDSRTRSVRGSLRYRMSQRISFALRAQYDERTTNNPLLNYDSTRVGLLTDVKF